MYLKWVSGNGGSIFFSKPGLRDFVESRIYEGVICRDIDIMDDNNHLLVSLVTAEDSFYLDKLRLSENLVKDLNSMGIQAMVSWIHKEEEGELEEPSFLEKPLFWGVVGTSLSAVLAMGIVSTLTCLMVGGAFYGLAVFMGSDSGKNIKESIYSLIKEILD
ncbi:hypothetical protein [Dethiosulfovibrio salsuginis]|uniref:Uncharacterized protein n=1 Tax=Dethiosulfovibrio salsuginis TaxID=561720 RepID=A0A1X7I2V0_9BACT|nr:hypothetical protein [Dethiosulfovibrio salsuginis]SMG08275.1 hypothetical protein SAMN06275492_10120 [Dethiosulfovibrio salsuginis]